MSKEGLGVLFRDRAKRIQCLKSNRHWFDCDQETFEKETEEIASLAELRLRVERVNAQMRRSITVSYQHLRAKFEFYWNQGKKASLNQRDLEGFSFVGLLCHYRLPPTLKSETDFATRISGSAENLLREENLFEVIERLSHLPLKMPESVVNEVINLSDEEKTKLFAGLLETLKSPLCKMQLIDLIMRAASGDQEMLERAKTLVAEIYDDKQGTADFNLFSAILRFVGEEIGYLREINDWSLPVKLAIIWAHAGKLFNLLQPIFGNEAGFRRWFWKLHQHSSTIFGEKAEYLHDCLNPRNLTRPIFQIHGAAAL